MELSGTFHEIQGVPILSGIEIVMPKALQYFPVCFVIFAVILNAQRLFPSVRFLFQLTDRKNSVFFEKNI